MRPIHTAQRPALSRPLHMPARLTDQRVDRRVDTTGFTRREIQQLVAEMLG